MAKIVKNISGSTKTWGGVQIENGQTYSCENQTESNKFALDDSFINDLSSSGAEVYIDSSKVIGTANSINILKGELLDTDGAPIVRSRAFVNTDGFRFRGSSFSGSCGANTTSDIDYKLTQERYINGGILIVDNIGSNDTLTFQVIDKDNILGYGANVVLDEFIKNYFIPQTGLLEVKLDYPAKIPNGLYLRLKYTSTHGSGCNIKCNLYLHWKA